MLRDNSQEGGRANRNRRMRSRQENKGSLDAREDEWNGSKGEKRDVMRAGSKSEEKGERGRKRVRVRVRVRVKVKKTKGAEESAVGGGDLDG